MAADAICRCVSVDLDPVMINQFRVWKPDEQNKEGQAKQNAGYDICLSHGATTFAFSMRIFAATAPTIAVILAVIAECSRRQ
jgi:hypothetical protein